MRATWVIAVAMLVAVGCDSEPPIVSNTGYVGTWTRGSDRVRTELEIRGDKETGYAVRWTLMSADGDREARCTWDGRCQEYYEGQLSAEHTLTTSIVGERVHLETRSKYYGDEARETWQIDELRVRGKGKILGAVTIERNGEPIAEGSRPRRVYKKLSDSVSGDGLAS